MAVIPTPITTATEPIIITIIAMVAIIPDIIITTVSEFELANV